MKLIKQIEGCMVLDLHGSNRLVLNWKDNMIEIYYDKEKKYVIDMNKE